MQPPAALDTPIHFSDGDHQVQPTTLDPGLGVHAAVPAQRRDSHPAGAGGLDLVQLRRFQWAVRAALVLGVAASVCANILHARDNFISQAIAAWPPLALMLTVELISRVPVYRRVLAALRMLATLSIAGIAAYVSYFHMAAVVARYGEHQPNPYLLPISVDGLIVVASVSLVELAGRVRALREHEATNRRAATPVHDTRPPDEQPLRSDEPLSSRAHRNGHAPAPPPVIPLRSPSVSEPATPLVAPVPAASEPEPATRPATSVSTPPVSEPAAPLAALLPAPPASEPGPPPVGSPADTHEDSDDARDADTDPDLAALLPAARAARDTLHRNGRSLTRDSLATQLRRDGHTIRTSRVSALLNLIKNDEPAPINGRRVQRSN
jgi:uncharacterized protein DUF2637